jgi:hypothetical protein
VIRVDAFRLLDEEPGIRVLQFSTLRSSVSECLDSGMTSVVPPSGAPDGPPVSWTRRGVLWHGRRHRRGGIAGGSPPWPVGRHRLRDAGGRVRTLTGVIVARRIAAVADFLRRRYVPDVGTALRPWLLGEGAAERLDRLLGLLETGDALLRNAEPWEERPELELVRPPGLAYEPSGMMHGLVPMLRRGACWFVLQESDRIEFALQSAIRIGGYDVPLELGATVARGSGIWTWFDGRRTGLAGGQSADLPAELRLRLEQGAVARSPGKEPFRPLADLRPRFVVVAPPADARRHAAGAGGSAPEAAGAPQPPPADRPALLLPSTAPLALLDARGEPLPLPVVAEPGAALDLLRRTSATGIYVPHADPCDPRDLGYRPSGSSWVGVDPWPLSA